MVTASIPPPFYTPRPSKGAIVEWKEIFCIVPQRCRNTNKLIWFRKGFRRQIFDASSPPVLYTTYRCIITSWFCSSEALLEQLKG
jgi:hypothetical protein